MAKIILDDCLQALYEAELSMADYVELTSYQTIFEADDPKVQAQQETNEEAKEKTGNALIRAVKAVKTMISSLINAIADFLRKLTMSSDERKSFNEFKAACASDPALKNKKITVKDYRNVMGQYDLMIKELEAGMRNAESMKESKYKELMRKASECLGKTIKSAGVIVSADAALKMAQSNIDMAKIINIGLKTDLGLVETLERGLGSAKAVERYQKKIEGCTKKISMQRLIVKLRRKKYECAKDACAATMNDLKSIATGKVWKNVSMAKNLANNENTSKVVKIGAKGAAMAGKEIVKDKVKSVTDKVDGFMDTKRGEGVNKKGTDFIMGGTKEERIVKKFNKRVDKIIKKDEKAKEKELKKAGKEMKKAGKRQDKALKKFENSSRRITEN